MRYFLKVVFYHFWKIISFSYFGKAKGTVRYRPPTYPDDNVRYSAFIKRQNIWNYHLGTSVDAIWNSRIVPPLWNSSTLLLKTAIKTRGTIFVVPFSSSLEGDYLLMIVLPLSVQIIFSTQTGGFSILKLYI